MIKILICFSTFIAFGICLSLTPASWEKCGLNPDVKSIDVTPCTAEPCAFVKGSTYTITTVFNADHDADNCKLEFKALVGGGWVQISNEDICGPTTLQCPMTEGKEYSLTKVLTVQGLLPNGVTQTEWTLNCNGGADQCLCARITVNVQ